MLILLPLNLIGQSILDDLCKDPEYPKTKIINGDTIVLFTQKQEKCIYIRLTQKDDCDVNLKLAESLISQMSSHTDTLKSKLQLKDLEIGKYKEKSIIDNKSIVTLKEKLEVEAKIQNVYINQLSKTKVNRNKLYIVGGVVITGLSTALILSLLN